MGKILVLGSSNTDMTVKTATLPAPGETVLGGDFTMSPGGKGANQAVAAIRAGGEVSFATARRTLQVLSPPSASSPRTRSPSSAR